MKSGTDIQKAAEIIQKGGLVVFPTETVYGIGADALNPEAVKKIYEAKGRPSNNPLIVHIGSKEQLINLISRELNIKEKLLIDKFWPGPLTLIFPRSKTIPDIITDGGETVAIRMPIRKEALELINLSGKPIAAPSANISGEPSPTHHDHVKYSDIFSKIDYLIEGGNCEIGLESTVLDLTEKIPVILRQGGLPKEKIEEVLNESIEVYKHTEGEQVKSPGLLYKHYSPNAQVVIIKNNFVLKAKDFINKNTDKSIGLAIPSEMLKDFKDLSVQIFDLGESIESVAANLFNAFIELDKNVQVILIPEFDEKGLGSAVMERIRRASSEIL